jgi:hypothetical protein
MIAIPVELGGVQLFIEKVCFSEGGDRQPWRVNFEPDGETF